MNICGLEPKANPIQWLLEENDPSVRYFTLKDLLNKSEDDPEVQEAKRAIMKTGIVPEMLQRQNESDYVDKFPRFYTDKYEGLVWSLITLAEMGAEPTPQIQVQCEYLLENSQEKNDGGFSINTAVRTGGGRIAEVIPCLTGNMVWALIRFGYLDDPRLQRAIEWLTKYMRFNDGVEEDPQVPPYNRFEMCWGAHTCLMAVVKALKGLSAIPSDRRTKAVNDTIHKATEFLLIHHVYKRSHDLSKISKPGWNKFSFPLMYQTDTLEVLDLLTGLGVKDERMEEAINLLINKRDDMGRWKAENTQNTNQLLIPFDRQGEQSKWITLRAMRVLRRYGQS